MNIVLICLCATGWSLVPVSAEETIYNDRVVKLTNVLGSGDPFSDTELITAFVIFRHGDRTPDQEELTLYPEVGNEAFFPFGMKALTNIGKQRGYLVGQYLRKRYDKFISKLYLPDEITVRTTDYARTKMTALTALAALYPPLPQQKWNLALNWQPVPYDTLAPEEDDLLYWYNCPRYLALRNTVYDTPEMKKILKPYQSLFAILSEKTRNNITTSEDVFFLDNLFQTLENVGVKPPEWAQKLMPKINEVTKIEYAAELYTPELIRLASGVLLQEIINASSEAIAGNEDLPKLRLYSAHENNVAALMAAAGVFQPHQPKYGSTFSLELRKTSEGEYVMATVYAPEAGGPALVLTVPGCGDKPYCEFETFVRLNKMKSWSKQEMDHYCPILP